MFVIKQKPLVKTVKTHGNRSSSPAVFCKKGVLRNLAKFTGLSPATLLKKSLWHKCYPMNFTEFLRAFFYRTTPVAASVESSCKIEDWNYTDFILISKKIYTLEFIIVM